ncbi:hypothetical protein PHYSODRAFT_293460 [Phytophthora sojae]|uniref:Uncharacterized protein n=1 Tax=Phytophthora sojae (strain P6497) TaxID=1094619 RepID=G4YH02_PHYSP|nr:hypothetical protein PHYSODRAFT_293460 [Phytophthora sojae]EGZ27703.1 hypothetical protein PHYSODRAFT_293460 [Phytophthora sojae]|eukprot:XP_009514978.1 hypothetical protein PHYSODRAFT_293460 [Phytophthora sojae]
MHSTTALSIEFRRTLQGCLLVQWLLVWIAVTLSTFSQSIRSAVESVFDEDTSAMLAILDREVVAAAALQYRTGCCLGWDGCTPALERPIFQLLLHLGLVDTRGAIGRDPKSQVFNDRVVPYEGEVNSGSPQQPEEPRDLDYPLRLDRALDFAEVSHGVIFVYLDVTILAWTIADMTTQCATLPLRVLGMELTVYYRKLGFTPMINSREHSCCPQCHEDDNYMVTDDTMRAHQHELRRRERALEKQKQGQEQLNQVMERV